MDSVSGLVCGLVIIVAFIAGNGSRLWFATRISGDIWQARAELLEHNEWPRRDWVWDGQAWTRGGVIVCQHPSGDWHWHDTLGRSDGGTAPTHWRARLEADGALP